MLKSARKKKIVTRVAAAALSVFLFAGACLAPVLTAYAATPETAETQQTAATSVEMELKGAPKARDGDVDAAIVCTLSPKKEEYGAGETMQFILVAQFSDPGDDSAPQTVKLGINLPHTDVPARLPMFNRTGTGDYAGMPMYSLNYGGNTVNMYLVPLDNGEQRIEFTLNAGETIQGILQMYLPNGVTEPIDPYTLVPEVLSTGTYGKQNLQNGNVKIDAQFGWEDVKMTSSTTNLGVISGAEHDPDRVVMTITADGQANGLASGAVFSDHYVLTANTDMKGLHIEDGVLTFSESAGVTSYFVDGVKVLEVGKPLAGLTVEKIVTDGVITGFKTIYRCDNATLEDPAPKPMPNLSIPITLFTSELKLNSSHAVTQIVTTTDFDAYSVFYDEAEGKVGEDYHAHSQVVNTVYTSDNYPIEKSVYTDEGCTEPFDVEDDFMEDGGTYYYKIVAKNQSSTNDTFIITDVLPNGLKYVDTLSAVKPVEDGQTITWNNVSIPAGGSHEIIVKTSFELGKISADVLNNVATLSHSTMGELNSASVRTTFRAGEGADSDISYKKAVSNVAGGVGDPLTFTIEVKNENPNASKYITVQDNWPGESVVPVSYTVSANGLCNEVVLLDADENSYSFEDVPTDVAIKKIQFKGLYIPAGGMVRLTIKSTIANAFDELVNTVQTGTGSGTPDAQSPPAYGMSISKNAYAYTDEDGIGKQLTIQDLMKKDDVVCYQIVVKNLKDQTIAGATVTDKLPASLPLTNGTLEGKTGQILIRQKGAVRVLSSTHDASNYYTTDPFNLDGGESVTLYLFTKVTDDTIAIAKNNKNCVTNAAFASFNSISTGDSKANFYIYEDKTKKLAVLKEVMWIGNYSDDLKLLDTGLKNWKLGDGDDIKNTTSIQKGNLVIYRIGALNATGEGFDIPIYEVLDYLPDGMEFVGVLKSGYHDVAHSTSSHYNEDLSDKLIRDGETAAWNNNTYPSGATALPYSADLTVHYDAASRKVQILINGGDINNPLNDVYTRYNTWYPYFFVVAKATESKPSYTNKVEIKTNKEVELHNYKATTRRTEGDFAYFGNSVTTYSVKMTPGITKSLLGHYFPADPSSFNSDPTIQPDESLRYQIQIKNQDNSTNYAAATGTEANAPTNSFIKTYTVTDILPAEYIYRPGSSTLAINRTYNTESGSQVTLSDADMLHKEPPVETIADPTVEVLSDGRTKLTWTFDEYKYRLLNNSMNTSKAKYKKLGFMNLLAYDVNRNPDYGSTYGSYTNMATAQFGYEFSNVSTGSPNYANHAISATNIVNVFGASGTSSQKTITNQAHESANGTGAVNKVQISAGEVVTYTLQVQNATANSEVGNLVFIDELPRETNDTGVVNRVDRNSEFSMLFTDTPNISVQLKSGVSQTPVDAAQYTVYYGTSTGEGLRAKGDWSVGAGGFIDWKENNSNGKNAIRIVFDDDFTLDPSEIVLISFDAKAAENLASGKSLVPGSIAWNSFGYAYRSTDHTDGTVSPIIHSEPQKVGAYLEGAKIVVSKHVAGESYPTDKPFTFQLTIDGTVQADVAYRLGDDPELHYTDETGSFTLNADETATLYIAPTAGGGVAEILMPDDFYLESATGDGTLDPEHPNRFVFGLAEDETIKTLNFTNRYTPSTPTTLDLKLTKTLAGNPLPQGTRFAFTLQRTDDGAASDVVMPSAAACKVETSAMTAGTSPVLNFGTITFKTAGFYSFRVSETATGMTGMTDAEPQTVYVLVEKDGTALKATVTDEDKNPIDGFEKLDFTNTYTPTPTTVAFPVKKTIDAENGLNLPTVTAFTFDLEFTSGDATGVTLPNPTSVTTEAITSGSSAPVSFGDISFTKAGEYHFTISEQASGVTAMTDAASKPITVTVTDTDGVLSASCSPALPAEGDGYEFTNTYAANKLTSAALNVTKQISGEALPTAKTFTFTLMLDSGDTTGVTMPTQTTATTTAIASGSAAPVGFGDIVFTKEGTYTFTISEQASGITGMTDAEPQTVTVEVTKQEGNLTPTITTAGGGGLVFTNTYHPAPANLQLGVQKKVNGDTLDAAKAFTFTLKLTQGDSSHVTLPQRPTVTTRAITHGKANAVYFGNITFTQAGIYTFEIAETATGIEGMKDAAPQTVTVTVTDENGQLKAVTATTKTLYDFVNEYQKPLDPPDPDPDPDPDSPTPTPTPPTPTLLTPNTGDETKLGLLLAVLAVSGAAFLGLCIGMKQKKK